MENEIRKTALFEIHKKLNGNIVNFAGAYLPTFYSSIQEEHNAVRNDVGLFDVSHMGNVEIEFPNLQAGIDFFNYLLPNNFSKIYPGKSIYSPMLKEDGTVIDDLIVTCLSDTLFHIVVNAANISKDYKWITSKITDSSIKYQNKSEDLSIIAVQGPKAKSLVEEILSIDLSGLKSFNVTTAKYKNADMLVSHSGYTGEDGFELIIDNQFAVSIFEELLDKGKKYNIKPCGLGSRDTLRLEAALPLYGHELDDKHSPLQSMIKWSVKLNKECNFIGKEALLNKENADTFKDIMIGIELAGRSIPRTDMKLVDKSGNEIGIVTSGTFSPTLQKAIGIAYINPDYINEPDLQLQIRNRVENIKIAELPFYKRSK